MDDHHKTCIAVALVAVLVTYLLCKRKCNCPEKFVPSAYFQSKNLLPQSRAPLSAFYGNNAASTVIEDQNIMKTVI